MQRASTRKTWQAFLTWLLGGVALAVLAVVIYSSQSAHAWTTAAVGLIVTAATALAGGAIGFVFGVPRLAAANGTGQGQSPIVGNTNLEQISDWLTKILVGVGLTQFGAIADRAGRMISSIAPAMGDGPAATVFTGGLALYSAGFGFITGWLYTRLLLGSAMADADRRARVKGLMHAARNAEQAGEVGAAQELRDKALKVLEDADEPPAVKDEDEAAK
ncbi:hypothetical protein [Dactylosporangium darangshiense]|uniref:Uncharacterized protein n=1 Tax=Dactylosporangium darangshiense TaxID=579108 RepID=A0ABP8DTP0_9ACTN